MNSCEQCKHFVWWMEYGTPLGDCGLDTQEVTDFVGSLDGVQDPAEAGCPKFEKKTPTEVEPEPGLF